MSLSRTTDLFFPSNSHARIEGIRCCDPILSTRNVPNKRFWVSSHTLRDEGVDACGFLGAMCVPMHLLDTKGRDDSRAIWSGLKEIGS